jgi:NADH-quinone oxidoreductase subunit A
MVFRGTTSCWAFEANCVRFAQPPRALDHEPTPRTGSARRDAMLKVTVAAHKPGPSQQPGHPPGRPTGGPYDGSWSELNAYIPILVLGAIGAAFAVGSVVIASLAGPRRYNRSKLAPYECGIEPTETSVSGPNATAGQRFPVKYYLTAMLFIVFDIEIVFLYPWAVSYDALGTFALVEMVVFMLTVFVAYAYVWRRGGLTWD